MELSYRLGDPHYTIYHRAALGGLAATIEAWRTSAMPEGIDADFDRDAVRIRWDSSLSDREALSRILAASFRVTSDFMIDLAGQALPDSRVGLRLALHNGYCGTFLQHNKMRPAPKGSKGAVAKVIRDADDAVGTFSYRPIESFAHQKAQKTGLLDTESFPAMAKVPQSVVPGALTGAAEIAVSTGDAILLLFLIVGSTTFLLRPRNREERAQYCIVVPDVADLRSFVLALRRLASGEKQIHRFTNTYLGRVVGGSEEAALKFQIDLATEDVTSHPAVRGCLAIAMGKVAWDKNQINRSAIVATGAAYGEMPLFREACEGSRAKIIPTQSGDSYAIPASPLPELIAGNLASGRHWSARLRELVSTKKDFRNLGYLHGGLVKMNAAIRSEIDHLIIDAFHDGWKRSMASIYDEAREAGADAQRKIEVMRERVRNDILRAKTQNQLAGWFLDFCARATGGASLRSIRDKRDQIYGVLFQPGHFEHLQNLFLFALLSYAGQTDVKGENA